MKLHVIDSGYFKLDGGATFGVVPKSIWNKSNPADENNLCNWAMRSLLVEDGDKRILIDTGIGGKQSEKFFSHYRLNGDKSLAKSLLAAGFRHTDITDVFLTHLHFDHCGGAIIRNNDKLVPAFPNARYWSNAYHWKWATQPNVREKASFLPENILPIQESGQLNLIDIPPFDSATLLPAVPFSPNFSIRIAYGHTGAMMLPQLNYRGHTLLYLADLLPSAGHIPLPYVMAYDTLPLITLQEKESLLNEAAQQNHILFFEHDPLNECCTVQRTDKGIRLEKLFALQEIT